MKLPVMSTEPYYHFFLPRDPEWQCIAPRTAGHAAVWQANTGWSDAVQSLQAWWPEEHQRPAVPSLCPLCPGEPVHAFRSPFPGVSVPDLLGYIWLRYWCCLEDDSLADHMRAVLALRSVEELATDVALFLIGSDPDLLSRYESGSKRTTVQG